MQKYNPTHKFPPTHKYPPGPEVMEHLLELGAQLVWITTTTGNEVFSKKSNECVLFVRLYKNIK